MTLVAPKTCDNIFFTIRRHAYYTLVFRAKSSEIAILELLSVQCLQYDFTLAHFSLLLAPPTGIKAEHHKPHAAVD
jgi:hypothetical protein